MKAQIIRNVSLAALLALLASGATFAADVVVDSSTTYSEGVTVDGTLTVTGSGTTLTLAAGKAITVTPGAGKVVVTDGASVKASSQSDDSLVLAAEADGTAVASGVADVLAVSGGSTVCLDFLNNAAATGRVAVAGGFVQFDRYSGYKWSDPTFEGNPWLVDVAEGATAYFNHSNQGGWFNAAGTSVTVTGAGSVRFGQRFNADAGGAFAVADGAVIANTGALELFGQHSSAGGVFRFGSGSKVDGPCAVTIGDGHDGRVVVQVDAGADFTVRDMDLVFVSASGVRADDRLCGDGTVKIDASEAAVTVAANVPAAFWDDATKANAIAFEKSGAYDALLAVTNIPALVVAEGTATLTNDCTIGELTVAAGATLVVDGATVRYASSAGSVGTIELRNGAAKVRVISGTAESGAADASLAMDRSGLASEGTLEKMGETDLIVYDPASVAGLVHVAGGALRFSKRGLSDRYLRLTVKECYPFVYEGNVTYNGLWTKVGLYDAADAFIDIGKLSGWGRGYPDGTAASELTENGWAVPAETLYGGSAPSVADVIGGNNKVFPDMSYGVPQFTNATRTLCKDASNESGWQKIWGRIHSAVPAIDGINFASGWGWGIVKTWTVETSATGADGTWQVVQDVIDMPHKLSYNNCGILNADATAPAAHFRYVEPGVTGLADTLQIRVDAGATLDFGAKTGGQVIDRVLIDATAESSGTVTNAVFAETGVIELVGGSDRSAKGLLPLVFEGVGGTANLANWTVECGGKACNRRVSFASAERKVELKPCGTMMIMR